MKTKNLLLLTLFSALSLQCSKNDDTDPISLPPAKPPVDNQDSSPEPKTGEVEYVPTVYAEGFSTGSNARLIVDSLSATIAPEFQYVVSWLDGSSDPMDWGSEITQILLHDNGRVYVKIPGLTPYSLLYVDDGWGGSFINYWDLEYAIIQSEGQPDEITITGTGKGSHLYEITNEAWLSSEITFEFRGVRVEGTDNFQGNFTLDEQSPDETYNLFLSGTLTLKRNPERD